MKIDIKIKIIIFIVNIVIFTTPLYAEVLYLDINSMYKKSLENLPTMSKLNVIENENQRMISGSVSEMLIPKVTFEINNSNLFGNLYKMNIEGDFLDFFLINYRKEYDKLKGQEKELRLLSAKQELFLSVAYPYLEIIENKQNIEIYQAHENEMINLLSKLENEFDYGHIDEFIYKNVLLNYERFLVDFSIQKSQNTLRKQELLAWMGNQDIDNYDIVIQENFEQIKKVIVYKG